MPLRRLAIAAFTATAATGLIALAAQENRAAPDSGTRNFNGLTVHSKHW